MAAMPDHRNSLSRGVCIRHIAFLGLRRKNTRKYLAFRKECHIFAGRMSTIERRSAFINQQDNCSDQSHPIQSTAYEKGICQFLHFHCYGLGLCLARCTGGCHLCHWYHLCRAISDFFEEEEVEGKQFVWHVIRRTDTIIDARRQRIKEVFLEGCCPVAG